MAQRPKRTCARGSLVHPRAGLSMSLSAAPQPHRHRGDGGKASVFLRNAFGSDNCRLRGIFGPTLKLPQPYRSRPIPVSRCLLGKYSSLVERPILNTVLNTVIRLASV